MQGLGRAEYNHGVRGPLLVVVISLASTCQRATPESLSLPPLVRAEPTPAPGPAPLRRLTRRQVEFVVEDVLGVAVPDGVALPDEPVVGGFEGAAEAQAPSELLVSRMQQLAQRVAERVVGDPVTMKRVLGCSSWSNADEQRACLDEFLRGTGRRLLRRPYTPEQARRLRGDVERWTAELGFDAAVHLTLEQLLQSPGFLYRPEPGPALDGFALASRLSLLLWNSAPDDVLLDAAAQGALSTREQVRAQAVRMLGDPRAARAMWSFHRQWLGLERLLLEEHSVRTPQVDAAWTPATQAAALDESRRFVEGVMTSEGTLEALLTSRRAWLDAETARLYGVTTFAPGQETVLDASTRAGVLTRAAFLASTAHRGATSPPIRGNAVNLKLLCRQTAPPPPGIDTTPPQKPAGVARTTRQVFEERTRPTACAGCHHALNALGFGFEHYDAAGGFRGVEDGLPVDATLTLDGTDVDGPVDGALELSARLAKSREVHVCATSMWVRYALGRAPVPSEASWVDALASRFVTSRGDVKALLVDLVSSPSFLALPEATP